jgi:aryl-alcohol dehydrogenase-like predicted oxidoreductase
MALSFVYNQGFVTSTIIGATSMEQLKENIDAKDIHLSKEVLIEIDKIHDLQPNPAP